MRHRGEMSGDGRVSLGLESCFVFCLFWKPFCKRSQLQYLGREKREHHCWRSGMK